MATSVVCVCPLCWVVQRWAYICNYWHVKRSFPVNLNSTPSSNSSSLIPPCFATFYLFSISIILRTSSHTSLYPSLPLPTYLPWMQHYKLSEPEMKTSSFAYCIATRISTKDLLSLNLRIDDDFNKYLIFIYTVYSCCRYEHTLQCRSVLFAEVAELALQVEKKDHLWYDHWNWNVAVWSIL